MQVLTRLPSFWFLCLWMMLTTDSDLWTPHSHTPQDTDKSSEELGGLSWPEPDLRLCPRTENNPKQPPAPPAGVKISKPDTKPRHTEMLLHNVECVCCAAGRPATKPFIPIKVVLFDFLQSVGTKHTACTRRRVSSSMTARVIVPDTASVCASIWFHKAIFCFLAAGSTCENRFNRSGNTMLRADCSVPLYLFVPVKRSQQKHDCLSRRPEDGCCVGLSSGETPVFLFAPLHLVKLQRITCGGK